MPALWSPSNLCFLQQRFCSPFAQSLNASMAVSREVDRNRKKEAMRRRIEAAVNSVKPRWEYDDLIHPINPPGQRKTDFSVDFVCPFLDKVNVDGKRLE